MFFQETTHIILFTMNYRGMECKRTTNCAANPFRTTKSILKYNIYGLRGHDIFFYA